MKRLTAIVITLSMLLVMMASIATPVSAASWSDAWTRRTGVTEANGALTVTAKSGETSTCRIPWTAQDKFDVEVTIQVTQFSGNEYFQICTGKHRLWMYLYENKFTYRNPNNTVVSVPYEIGYDAHTYRAVGNNGHIELAIDGYFVDEFDVYTYTTDPNIGVFVTGQNNKTSQLIISNGIVHDVNKTTTTTPEVEEKEEEENAEPAGEFRLDFDSEEDEKGWSNLSTWHVTEDGVFKADTLNTSWQSSTLNTPGYEGDYIFTARMRWPAVGNGVGFQLYNGDRYIGFRVWQDDYRMDTRYNSRISAGESGVYNDEWHTLRAETYGMKEYIKLYIDDELIFDVEAPTVAEGARTNYIYIFARAIGTDNSWLEYDWMKWEPKEGKPLTLKTPFSDAEYLEGEPIPLAIEGFEGDENSKVEYKIDGNTVATGVAPDYSATLNGLEPGTYQMTVECGADRSRMIPFRVLPAIDGEVRVQEKDNDHLAVGLDIFDKMDQIQSVDYLVDGVPMGTATSAPYEITVSASAAAQHTITAICRDASGVKIGEVVKDFYPSLNGSRASLNYSNYIKYNVSGTNGTAEYELKNGNHQVKMVHSPDAVTYLTDTGAQSFSPGIGDFEILTDGATADVYRNGQFAFSYYLPRTQEVTTATRENGLSLSDLQVSVPEERKNYFVKRNVTDQKATYSVSNIPHDHHLDFVAGKDDQARLVANDGYYKTDITLEDGKIYAWVTLEDRSEPFRNYIADMLDTEEDVYYRVETAAGLSRLYGNGRWMASFRNAHCVGNNVVAIDVTKGELPYVAVSDDTDIYFYSDDFKGNAEFESVDYWRENNVNPYVDTDAGAMIVNAGQEENKIIDLSVYAGKVDFSADINIKQSSGGVWMVLAHSVTDAYMKMGYNFVTGQYEVVNQLPGKNPAVLATAEGSMPKNKSVHWDLKIREDENGEKLATLVVNGNPIFSNFVIEKRRGKVGFAISKSVAYLGNVSYRGDAKPVLGVTDSTWPNSQVTPTRDVIEIDDQVIQISSAGRVITTDGGRTWTMESAKTGDDYNMVRLQNGDLLSMRQISKTEDGVTLKNFKSMRSSDNGATWEDFGEITPKWHTHNGAMSNRLTQGRSGRIYFGLAQTVNEAFGEGDVLYSDDNGETWNVSAQHFDALELGYSFQEHKIIEMESGVTRMFFRSNYGYLRYFDSYDRGETWDMTPHDTSLFSALNCYNIEEDPYNPGVFYAAWGYDNVNLSATDQHPRTRWALAQSTDEGKTWQFLGTVYENTDLEAQMMNLNVSVTKDYLALSGFCDDTLSTSAWYARFVLIKKDTLKPAMDFEQVHLQHIPTGRITNTEIVAPLRKERLLLVDPENGGVQLHGSREQGAAYDEYISLACAAAYVGGQMVAGENGAMNIQVGEKTVTFGTDALSEKDGKVFVKVKTFAEQFNLYVVEQNGVKIVSPYDSFLKGQRQDIQNAVDMFVDEI